MRPRNSQRPPGARSGRDRRSVWTIHSSPDSNSAPAVDDAAGVVGVVELDDVVPTLRIGGPCPRASRRRTPASASRPVDPGRDLDVLDEHSRDHLGVTGPDRATAYRYDELPDRLVRQQPVDAPPVHRCVHCVLSGRSLGHGRKKPGLVASAGTRRGARPARRRSARPSRPAARARRGRSRRRRPRSRRARCCSSSGGGAGERPAQPLAGVRVGALVVRVVAPPHEAVEPDLVARRRLDRAREARADPAVAVEVLARRPAAAPGRACTSARRCGRSASAAWKRVELGEHAGGTHDAPCSVSTKRRSGKRSNTPPMIRCVSARREKKVVSAIQSTPAAG